MRRLIVIALLGSIAQLVDGTLGMAYGVTATTALLLTGITPAVASASVHLAEVGTTLASGVAHWRFGNVDWRVVALIGVPGGIGAFAGATFLSSLTTESASLWVAALLILLGVYILVRFATGKVRAIVEGRLSGRLLGPLGLAAGFIDATGGGGWGPVATSSLLSSGKLQPRKTVGSVSAAEFIVSVAASVGFLFGLGSKNLPLDIVAALLIGGVLAAPLAAWLVSRLATRWLGVGVSLVLDPHQRAHAAQRARRRHRTALSPVLRAGAALGRTGRLRLPCGQSPGRGAGSTRVAGTGGTGGTGRAGAGCSDVILVRSWVVRGLGSDQRRTVGVWLVSCRS